MTYITFNTFRNYTKNQISFNSRRLNPDPNTKRMLDTMEAMAKHNGLPAQNPEALRADLTRRGLPTEFIDQLTHGCNDKGTFNKNVREAMKKWDQN